MDVKFGSLLYRQEGESYLSNISLTDKEKEEIRAAKDSIRSCLKQHYPEALERLFGKKPVIPRFFTQGSYKYNTLNAPEKVPPQQADIDDGCYLPMEYITDVTAKPSVASEAVFKAAENALTLLCKSKNWDLITEKDTCLCIIISQKIHVDIPLYAIPSTDFKSLERMLVCDSALHWDELPVNDVLLAHRKKGWTKSDPREVSEWFRKCIKEKGEQFRRIIRYIKAIRDHLWESGGPSSLLLMVIISHIYISDCYEDDSDALRSVLMEMPDVFLSNVINPCDKSESLTERLGDKGCHEAKEKFYKVSVELTKACENVTDQTKGEFIRVLRKEIFGSRLPDDESAVKVTNFKNEKYLHFERTKAG